VDTNLWVTTQHGGHRVMVRANKVVVQTPPIEHLVFYAGLGVLIAVESIEWPVAAALMIGHLLVDLTNRPGLQAVGEVLEEV
jgi:hypothetical protein